LAKEAAVLRNDEAGVAIDPEDGVVIAAVELMLELNENVCAFTFACEVKLIPPFGLSTPSPFA
jgi:hypothetical protein